MLQAILVVWAALVFGNQREQPADAAVVGGAAGVGGVLHVLLQTGAVHLTGCLVLIWNNNVINDNVKKDCG